MNVELNGTIKMIGQTTQVSEKFAKREFVVMVDTETQYPQAIPVQFTQDKCSILDGFQVGQNVKVSANLRSNIYENPTKGTQYFVNFQAWKIEATTQQQPNNEVQYNAGKIEPVATAKTSEEINDDLPF